MNNHSAVALALTTSVLLSCGDRVGTIAKDGLEYVTVPGGEGWLGCDTCGGPRLRHFARVPPFALSRTEVTVAAYRAFVAATGAPMPPASLHDPSWSRLMHPIERVTGTWARQYCNWVGGRLPTEDEWEWAARGGLTNATYPWGDSLSHWFANYEGTDWRDKWEATAPVGGFPANGYGLFDMAGNVSEFAESDPQETFWLSLRGGGWSSTGLGLGVSGRMPAKVNWEGGGFRCLLPLVAARLSVTPSTGEPPNPSLQRTHFVRR